MGICVDLCFMKYFTNNWPLSVIKFRRIFGWCVHKMTFNFWVLIKVDFYLKYYMLLNYELKDTLLVSIMLSYVRSSFLFYIMNYFLNSLLLQVQHVYSVMLAEGDRPRICLRFAVVSLPALLFHFPPIMSIIKLKWSKFVLVTFTSCASGKGWNMIVTAHYDVKKYSRFETLTWKNISWYLCNGNQNKN